MIDRIEKQDSLVRRIVDGSVTIDSVKEFEKLFKVFPKDPYLHRVFADLLKQNKSFEAAVDAYESATQLFIEADLTLQAIVTKILEWRIFRPSDQEGQAFYSSLREGSAKNTALQRFFIDMTYPEMIAFMFALMPRRFSAGSTVKRFGDEEAFRDGPFDILLIVTGRKKQILATLALIGTGRTRVDNKSKESVVYGSGTGPRRDLDHHRTIFLKVKEGGAIDRVGVAGKKQRIAVHQLIKDQDLVVFDPERSLATSKCFEVGCGHPTQKSFHGANVVEMVVERGRSLFGWNTVEIL